ncbi:MAG: hypothetical protein GY762_09980, partial [Proteobacteria bacterium]|nr:hypothetical protein [Pseudomonadota bacterium]
MQTDVHRCQPNHSLRKRIRRVGIVAVLMALLLVSLAVTSTFAVSGIGHAPQDISHSSQNPSPQQDPSGCVEGYKIDDLHTGLPGWVIHARPVGSDQPVYTQITDGIGYFGFDDIAVGRWLFWEEMQEGWVAVTPAQFEAEVLQGPDCTQIRFKNRQGTPSPTPTPTQVPATRIRGYVLEETCDGRFPLGNVTLTAWNS